MSSFHEALVRLMSHIISLNLDVDDGTDIESFNKEAQRAYENLDAVLDVLRKQCTSR